MNVDFVGKPVSACKKLASSGFVLSKRRTKFAFGVVGVNSGCDDVIVNPKGHRVYYVFC